MQEVHDYLEGNGACTPSLAVFSAHESLTLIEFFSRWYDSALVPERTKARWSYWLVFQYYTEDIFPQNILGLCIELAFDREHRMPEMQALQLFRKIKNYMPEEERKKLCQRFLGKLPRVETPEDCT